MIYLKDTLKIAVEPFSSSRNPNNYFLFIFFVTLFRLDFVSKLLVL